MTFLPRPLLVSVDEHVPQPGELERRPRPALSSHWDRFHHPLVWTSPTSLRCGSGLCPGVKPTRQPIRIGEFFNLVAPPGSVPPECLSSPPRVGLAIPRSLHTQSPREFAQSQERPRPKLTVRLPSDHLWCLRVALWRVRSSHGTAQCWGQ